jgi:hypothetical protein
VRFNPGRHPTLPKRLVALPGGAPLLQSVLRLLPAGRSAAPPRSAPASSSIRPATSSPIITSSRAPMK